MIIPCGKRQRPGSPSARWRRAFPLILRAGDTRGLLEVPRKAGCHKQTPGLFLLGPVRLTVRIAGFQSADGGSIPPRAACGEPGARRETVARIDVLKRLPHEQSGLWRNGSAIGF